MSAAFEGWACVELLGHRIRYGYVREVTMFGEAFAQVDIPSDPPVREFYGGKSIYGLTPHTEDECRKQNEPWKPRPALSAPVDADVVDNCGNCGEPLGDEPTERVAIDDGSDYEVWHQRCALKDAERLDPEDDDVLPPDPVDSDAPRSPS